MMAIVNPNYSVRFWREVAAEPGLLWGLLVMFGVIGLVGWFFERRSRPGMQAAFCRRGWEKAVDAEAAAQWGRLCQSTAGMDRRTAAAAAEQAAACVRGSRMDACSSEATWCWLWMQAACCVWFTALAQGEFPPNSRLIYALQDYEQACRMLDHLRKRQPLDHSARPRKLVTTG